LEGNDLEPTWRCLINLEEVSWLSDHVINDDIIFPAAGYIAMVGEASRQLSGIRDYTVQNALIKTALVLKEGSPIEIITSLRPHPLTDSLDSVWYDFSISSYNGTWMKHCSGQVMPGGHIFQDLKIEALAREIVSPYQGLSSVGLNYGPHFQGLKQVSTKPGSQTATATVASPKSEIQDWYQLHPTSIDCCLQLFLLAVSEGISRRADRIFVPTEIKELYIGRTSPQSEILAHAISIESSSSSITGNAMATSLTGEVVLSLNSGLFTAVDNISAEPEATAGAELVFAPDINFSFLESLILPEGDNKTREGWLTVEKLAMVCMIEIKNRLAELEPIADHFHTFKSWLASQLDRTKSNEGFMIATVLEGEKLSTSERCAIIDALYREALSGKASAVGALVKRVLDNCENLFQGNVQPLEILLPDDGLTKLYNTMEGRTNSKEFFACLGHANPTMKVLEIGAGTGGTTNRALKGLIAPNGARLYSKYTLVYFCAIPITY
jgi:hypothetical protein